MLSPRQKSLLTQIAFAALGVGLLVLALRPVEFDQLWAALRDANYFYLVPLAVIALLSHALRAWRWLLLLETLPEAEGRATSLRTSFYSVMIGYMVNYAAPRLGEVARAGNLAAHSHIPFSAALGTVVIERILDVLTLGICFLLAFWFAAGQMAALMPLLEDVGGGLDISGFVLLAFALAAVSLLGVAYIIFRWLAGRTEGRAGRVAGILRTFQNGMMSLVRAPRRVALVLSTAGMWLCYLVMAYIPFAMLGITGLGLADALILLIVGSVAMIVPSPGGLGSFHYLTIQTMTRLFGVGVSAATAYAVLGHASQLVLYTVTGFICLLLQGRGLTLRLRPEQVESPATSVD